MSKTTAPLLSFGAAGQLAKTGVYSSWKGIPYVRRYVVPANPRTSRQVVTRSLFKFLQMMWLLMPADGKAPWEANAKGQKYTPANKFTSSNVKGVDTESPPTDMSAFVGSPGAKGGLPPASLAVNPGVGILTCPVGAPVIPTGWSIVGAYGIAFINGDPANPFSGAIQSQSDLTSTYSLVFTGLSNADEYVVSAWFKWMRPDGTFAYGPSLTGTGTPT